MDKENGNIYITKECNLVYKEHNYIKSKIALEKIKSKNVDEDIIESPLYQSTYFKYMTDLHPSLTYDDIVLELIDRFKVKQIKFSKSQFSNFKNRKKEKINIEYYQVERFKNLKLYEVPLQKLYMEYYDENSKKNQFFRIFATEESLKLLSSKNISQYFIDSTYRCIPNSQNNYEAFVLLIGYNTIREMFELCCCAIFSKEDTIIYKKFYETLKYNYSFEPKKITMDLALAYLNSVRDVYGS